MKKRFSISKKLIFIFCALIAIALLAEGILAVRIARKAVTEKVEIQLIDKANDTAEIIEGRLSAFFQMMQGIARMPFLSDNSCSYPEKAILLQEEAKHNKNIKELDVITMDGTFYYAGGSLAVQDREYFKQAITGKNYVSEPYTERATGSLVTTLAVPIYEQVFFVPTSTDYGLPIKLKTLLLEKQVVVILLITQEVRLQILISIWSKIVQIPPKMQKMIPRLLPVQLLKK